MLLDGGRMASTGTTRRIASVKPNAVKKPLKERVLIEFPAAALRRTDEAAEGTRPERSWAHAPMSVFELRFELSLFVFMHIMARAE